MRIHWEMMKMKTVEGMTTENVVFDGKSYARSDFCRIESLGILTLDSISEWFLNCNIRVSYGQNQSSLSAMIFPNASRWRIMYNSGRQESKMTIFQNSMIFRGDMVRFRLLLRKFCHSMNLRPPVCPVKVGQSKSYRLTLENVDKQNSNNLTMTRNSPV